MSAVAVTVERDVAVDPALVAAWCKAVDRQARECAEAWGIDYTPVVFFSPDVLEKLDGQDLTDFVTRFRLLTIQRELNVPGVGGYHNAILGVVFARVRYDGDDYTSVTLSHEVLEQMVNPLLTSWAALPDGRQQAVEACDRVEDDTYNIEMDGVHVRVSNYLLPSAFVPDSPRPWDLLGRLDRWDGMTPGGYMIVRSAEGERGEVFAASSDGETTALNKRMNETSRLARMTGHLPPPILGIDRTTAPPVLPVEDQGTILEDFASGIAEMAPEPTPVERPSTVATLESSTIDGITVTNRNPRRRHRKAS